MNGEWKTKFPGELLGKKRYLEILAEALERSKPGYSKPLPKWRVEPWKQ